jgi:hypothetical protein
MRTSTDALRHRLGGGEKCKGATFSVEGVWPRSRGIGAVRGGSPRTSGGYGIASLRVQGPFVLGVHHLKKVFQSVRSLRRRR